MEPRATPGCVKSLQDDIFHSDQTQQVGQCVLSSGGKNSCQQGTSTTQKRERGSEHQDASPPLQKSKQSKDFRDRLVAIRQRREAARVSTASTSQDTMVEEAGESLSSASVSAFRRSLLHAARPPKEAQDLVSDPQRQAINGCEVLPGQSLFVQAGPGVGKTFEILQWKKKRPELRALFLAYNGSVRTDLESRAKNLGLANFKVSTIDSFAWHLTKHIHGQTFGDLLIPALINCIKDSGALPAGQRVSSVMAHQVKDALNNFIACDCLESPTAYCRQHCKDSASLSSEDTASLVGYVWQQMLDPNVCSTPMTHGACMKALQQNLSACLQAHPQWLTDFDVVILDEAQDATDATLHVVSRLVREHMKSAIIIGDEHQRIYGFRLGDSCQFKKEGYDFSLPLSGSLRFGPKLAKLVECLIHNLKPRAANYSLQGRPHKETHICILSKRDPLPLGQGNLHVLARKNAYLFEYLANMCVSGLHDNVRLGFVGGADSYNFQELVLDLYYLYSNQKDKIKDLRTAQFDSLESFRGHARRDRAADKLVRVNIVYDYGHDIPRILEWIRQRTVKESQADICISTVHKAKGLTAQRVLLAGQFLEMQGLGTDLAIHWRSHSLHRWALRSWQPAGQGLRADLVASILEFLPAPPALMFSKQWEEEVNCLYVAASRAACELYIAPELAVTWKMAVSGSYHPGTNQQSKSRAKPPKCFFPGLEVQLQGLKGAPHLNGASGKLESFDVVTGRWHVLLNREIKAVKPENIIPASPTASTWP
eukprot:TRINITY_DN103274_c0_g1_i1.p1 TRINITY_DN103274_c0_g1~~TRINITY_DN103274_c0_g1_i1.p1  ORF type:complete len:767 (-),score=99.09 TRINITY_DN103274_c0_g1_i1:754-3054(-)